MMSLEYINKFLKETARIFPSVHFKYGYNNIISTHIVEILPLDEFETNESLMDLWIEFSFEFRNAFPKEEITFVSSDSTLSLFETIVEYNTPIFNTGLNDFFATISTTEFNFSFPTFMPDLKVDFTIPFSNLLSTPIQKIDYETSNTNSYQEAA